MKSNLKIILFTSNTSSMADGLIAFLTSTFIDVEVFRSSWGEKIPDELYFIECDYVISYLSRWIIPEEILKRARIAAINFHPAPPEYPGVGCNNFALYDNSHTYGVTCHHMKKVIDSGEIIAVKRFPVFESDNVESLLLRTYSHLSALFYDIISVIVSGGQLPSSDEKWREKPFTRNDLNLLATITPDMDSYEIKKRIRATNYKEFKTQLKIEGYVFELKEIK